MFQDMIEKINTTHLLMMLYPDNSGIFRVVYDALYRQIVGDDWL